MKKNIVLGKLKIPKIHYLYILIFVLFYLFLFYINSKSPLVGEDLILTPWNFGKEPITLISKFVLVFNRVFLQASNWNARIGELLAIIFAAFNKNLYNIISSLIVTILILVLFIIGFGRYPNWKNKQDLVGLFILIFLVICLNPLLGELIFWKSGTMNHTWGITFLFNVHDFHIDLTLIKNLILIYLVSR